MAVRAKKSNPDDLVGRLRARREWPRRYCAAEKANELPLQPRSGHEAFYTRAPVLGWLPRPAMNVQLNLRMGKREFLTWVQSREGRYELAHRRVVMMTGGSRGHGIIVRRLARALERRLDAAAWTVLTSDFGVDIGGDTIRYPDVLVDRAGGRRQDLTATAPCLIAEVLSPSSINVDLRDEAIEYRRLPSLQACLVLSHEEPKAWAWIRAEAGLPGQAGTIAGRDAGIIIAELGITLPLGEIYPDIGTA